jgi:hypothetical protein
MITPFEHIRQLERQIKELEKERHTNYLKMRLEIELDCTQRLNNVMVELAKLRFSK